MVTNSRSKNWCHWLEMKTKFDFNYTLVRYNKRDLVLDYNIYLPSNKLYLFSPPIMSKIISNDSLNHLDPRVGKCSYWTGK